MRMGGALAPRRTPGSLELCTHRAVTALTKTAKVWRAPYVKGPPWTQYCYVF